MQSQKTIVKMLTTAFNWPFRQAQGSYDLNHTLIRAIACDVMRGWIKRINPCDWQVEI